MPVRLTYKATIAPMANRRLAIQASILSVNESLSKGWSGSIRFHSPNRGGISHTGSAFGWLASNGILAGKPVLISCRAVENEETGNEGQEGLPVEGATPPIPRYWPSIVQNITVSPNPLSDNPQASLCEVEFVDIISYLAIRPIWGVFVDRSPAEILGGALTLASGGSGAPTAAPVLPNLVTPTIHQALRTELERVPYVIATGERFLDWIEYVFGHLGVRFEMVGDRSGQIGIRLKDSPPAGNPLVLSLTESRSLDYAHARLGTVRSASGSNQRGAILDNPATGDFRRLGTSTGSVESVINSALTAHEEAERRSNFSKERVDAQSFQAIIKTAQTAMIPGRIIKLVDHNNENDSLWQAIATVHAFRSGVYFNRASLVAGGSVWRAAVPISPGRSSIVSAVVDDGESTDGEMVPRDRLNRIPIRFSFAQHPPEGTENSPSNPPRVMLPSLEQMAGESHGFFSSNRQGDVCRIAVRNPFFSEIIGFEYRDNLRVGQYLVDSSAGVVIQHGDTEWSGLLFRPNSLVDGEGALVRLNEDEEEDEDEEEEEGASEQE